MNVEKKLTIDSLGQQLRWSAQHLNGALEVAGRLGDDDLVADIRATVDATLPGLQRAYDKLQERSETPMPPLVGSGVE
jgi:hypothetical protein